jgi:hypothetical protein
MPLGNGIEYVRTGPDYGGWKYGRPFGMAIHCLQCPGNVNVRSLVGPGSYSANAGVSPHTMSGPTKIVELLDASRSGAHVGAGGNAILAGAEVTGMAEWDRAGWQANSASVLNQAKAVGLSWASWGFDVKDLKWGSVNELIEARRRHDAGLPPVAPRLWIHWDVSKAGSIYAPLRGTNHWDVGLSFLFEDFPRWAAEWVTGRGASNPGVGTRPDPGILAPGGPSGAQSSSYIDRLLHKVPR